MKKQQRGRTGSHRRPRKSPERQKSVLFDIISGTVLIVAVCVFVFSLYQLVMMLIPYYTGGKEYDEIQDLAVEADADGTGFSVDFDELLAINSDMIAWIRFDEPSIINYPVVKSADNEEYLTKTFAENDNKLGAIFMDMRNNSDFSDRNTIIYGHHLNVSPDMFSRLNLYEDEEFCREHPDFYIYTPDGKVYEAFLGKCSADSAYPVDVELNAQSQIITLSTCTNDGDANRFVVRGVLTAID